jgi:Reverse transcriptase (RNA-dependent DNA polymerase)
VDTESILARGFFPKELPPIFSTEAFARAATAGPLEVHKSPRTGPGVTSLPASHSLGRPGHLRRRLHVPNPFSFLNVAMLVSDDWPRLDQHCSQSPISLSRPVADPDQRRCLIPRCSGTQLFAERLRLRANSRFILQTDIARFYPSIYTHSIPWALDGKLAAKKKRKGGLGNNLDKAIRIGQDGQTLGVPIGPDTSLLIAESILTLVDQDIAEADLKAIRFMDDFEVACGTRHEAEQALHLIDSRLADFELAINPRKTRIVDLPTELDNKWRHQIMGFRFSGGKTRDRDLIRFFDLVFGHHRQAQSEAVISYALSRLRSITFTAEAWAVLRPILCQCLAVEPACIRFVNRLLLNHSFFPIAEEVETAFNMVIASSGGATQGSEVAWALWSCLLLGIRIQPLSTKVLALSRDPFVKILALRCRDKDLIADPDELDVWTKGLDADSLYDENWIFLYQAMHEDWISVKEDYVGQDANFSQLADAEVSFLLDVSDEDDWTDDWTDPYEDDESDDDYYEDEDADQEPDEEDLERDPF